MTTLYTASGSVLRLSPSAFSNLEPATSPLLWLVNVCWPSCAFCMALEADWQKLARRLKHEAVVATWDAGRRPDLPEHLGETNTTPTIRAMVPNPIGGASTSSTFRLVEYHGSRTFADLLRFAHGLMPNYVHQIDSAESFESLLLQQRDKLKLLCFLGLAPDVATPPMLRALSAAYRNRVVVIDVRVHANAPQGVSSIAARFGVSALPSVIALRRAADGNNDPHGNAGESVPWWHDGPPTHRRLDEWLGSLLKAEEDRELDERKDELAVAASAVPFLFQARLRWS